MKNKHIVTIWLIFILITGIYTIIETVHKSIGIVISLYCLLILAMKLYYERQRKRDTF